MFDLGFGRGLQALSLLFDVLAACSHAHRLSRIRWAATQAVFGNASFAKAEVETLKQQLRQLERAEDALATADLTLPPSRLAAVAAYQAAIARIQAKSQALREQRP